MADTFAHRKNVDGTWDAICMTCYMTAASATSEAALRETEPLHKCDGSIGAMAMRLTDLLQQKAK